MPCQEKPEVQQDEDILCVFGGFILVGGRGGGMRWKKVDGRRVFVGGWGEGEKGKGRGGET